MNLTTLLATSLLTGPLPSLGTSYDVVMGVAENSGSAANIQKSTEQRPTGTDCPAETGSSCIGEQSANPLKQVEALLAEAKGQRLVAEQALADSKSAEALALKILARLNSGDSEKPVSVKESAKKKPAKAPENYLPAAGLLLQTNRGSKVGETLSDFAQNKLGLDKYQDYADEDGIGFRISGAKDGGDAQIGPVFTWRNFVGSRRNPGTFFSTRKRLQTYFRAALDDDGIGQIGNLKKGDFSSASDFGFGFDYRWTRTRAQDLKTATEKLAKMLAEFDSICPAGEGKNGSERGDSPTASSVFDDPKCAEALKTDGRARKLYLSGIGQFFGLDAKGKDIPPTQFMGLQGEFNFQEEKFFPLSDPGQTGVELLAALPSDLDDDLRREKNFNPGFVKFYSGMTFKELGEVFRRGRRTSLSNTEASKRDKDWKFYIASSFGYENAVRYPTDTQGVELCYDDSTPLSSSGTFSKCKKVNIAAPYTVEGFTLGLGLNMKFPETRIGEPKLGALASYFEGTDQWKLSVPLAFAVDDKNKVTAGIRFDYLSDGQTPWGTEIGGSKTFGIFLEYDLDFPFVP